MAPSVNGGRGWRRVARRFLDRRPLVPAGPAAPPVVRREHIAASRWRAVHGADFLVPRDARPGGGKLVEQTRCVRRVVAARAEETWPVRADRLRRRCRERRERAEAKPKTDA